MEHHLPFANPALTISLALAAGMLAQVLARHLGVPGIVLLLAAGVGLGPDGLNIIRPESLGSALPLLVGFSVAIILFEGGMHLNIKRLRRQATPIRRLVTLGALITAVGAALTVWWVLDWDPTRALLFGTLVIVTGPTVINPLLRRIKIVPKVATVLEAEGVFGDAIGALVAVITLEAAISGISGSSFALGAWHLLYRLGIGALIGVVLGLLIVATLRFDKIVPEGLDNVLTLSLLFAGFEIANTLVPESGIVSVTIAGLVVGNAKKRMVEDLKEFKEQLTALLIGMLFVLLAADVRLSEVVDLGWPGVYTVLSLMFIVRPLNALASTVGSDLTMRERLFICWLAPRGIVAAAVSSLFAQSLHEAGLPGGTEFRALVFLVIATTVVVQGFTGGLVASLLGLRQPSGSGFVIVGANPLGRVLGQVFRDEKVEILFVDRNAQLSHAAEEENFRVLYGDALSESILYRAKLESRAGCIAVTPNAALNLLVAAKARGRFKTPDVWVALSRSHGKASRDDVKHISGRILFGAPRSLDTWILRLERSATELQRWQREKLDNGFSESVSVLEDLTHIVLPLTSRRGYDVRPVDDRAKFKCGDILTVLVVKERTDEAAAGLTELGWTPIQSQPHLS